MHSQVAARLSEHAYHTGDLQLAMEMARLALVNNPLNEVMQYLLLQVLIKTGHLSEARQFFYQLEELLRRELDTTPSPMLADLYLQAREQIKEDRPTLNPMPAWRLHPSLQVPFIGRKSILEQLTRISGRGGCVLIFGESGQGKTRLIQEFTTKDHWPKTRLLLSTCQQVERHMPFHPLVQLFRHYILPEEWLSLPASWLNSLALIFPEILTIRPDLSPPLPNPEQETRALLFEAIRQVFLHLAQQNNRLLLCIDDAQWSDEATLATAAYLAKQPPFDQKAFLLLAAREEEENPYLASLIASHYPVIRLDRMNQDEIGELAHKVSGYTISDQFIQRLSDETGGNPLFILETLRFLLESGVPIQASHPHYIPLAKSIQALLHDRLARLTPAARSYLEAAAVIGRGFNAQVAGEISEQPASRITDVLKELKAYSLIEALNLGRPDFPAHYRFTHEIFREVVLLEINPLQKRHLHELIVTRFEARMAERPVEHSPVLAEHLEYSGETRRAFDYWMQSGRRARQLFSSADALQAFARAASLVPSATDLSEEQLHDLFSEWTELAYILGEVDTIHRINQDLLQLGQARGSPNLIGTALSGLAYGCMAANRLENGLDLINQAIHVLKEGMIEFELVEAYNRKGSIFLLLNQIGEAIASFEDALAVRSPSRDLQNLQGRGNAHYQIAVARVLSGSPVTGRQHAQRSLADFSLSNNAYGQAIAYSALALAYYYLGGYSRAFESCQKGRELAERTQSQRLIGTLSGYQAMIELATGNLDAVAQQARQAISSGERYGYGEIASTAYRVLGDSFGWLYRHDLASDFYQRALAASGGRLGVVDPLFRLALVRSRLGKIDYGLKIQSRSLEMSKNSGLVLSRIMAELIQLMIELQGGDWERVKSHAANLYEKTLRHSLTSARLETIKVLGEAARHDGDLPAAIDYFRRGAQEASCLPQPWIELRNLKQLNLTLRQAGTPEDYPCQRIQSLLKQIEKNATDELFRSAFLDFKQSMLAQEF
jgi:predicted ATPase